MTNGHQFLHYSNSIQMVSLEQRKKYGVLIDHLTLYTVLELIKSNSGLGLLCLVTLLVYGISYLAHLALASVP